jgi:hypothetical protein
MMVSAARKRTVVFRVSREDYSRLETEAAASGFAIVNDYVRSRLMRAIGEPILAGVGRKLDELETAMQQLSDRVETT